GAAPGHVAPSGEPSIPTSRCHFSVFDITVVSATTGVGGRPAGAGPGADGRASEDGIRREPVADSERARGQRSRPVAGEGGRRGKPRRSGAGGIKQLAWRQPVNRYPAVEVLTPDGLEAIHDASMRLLET